MLALGWRWMNCKSSQMHKELFLLWIAISERERSNYKTSRYQSYCLRNVLPLGPFVIMLCWRTWCKGDLTHKGPSTSYNISRPRAEWKLRPLFKRIKDFRAETSAYTHTGPSAAAWVSCLRACVFIVNNGQWLSPCWDQVLIWACSQVQGKIIIIIFKPVVGSKTSQFESKDFVVRSFQNLNKFHSLSKTNLSPPL